MTVLQPRSCCFCFPVRFGVFFIAILGMLGGAAFSTFGWFELARLKDNLTKMNEISLYIHSVIYTLFVIISIVGFIAAVARRRTLISIYFSMLTAHVTFSIFSGAFALYNLFRRNGQESIQRCMARMAESQTQVDCAHAFNIVRGVAVGVFIVIWLWEIWACFIVNSYATQLEDEEFAQWKLNSDIETSQIEGPRPL
jgi:multisubunit Na+/H+ antiporter MnhG subunit